MTTAGRVGFVAILLAGSVLLSRALGFAREILLARHVGISYQADAYSAAFQIPDILNYLLAAGASVALVPFYTQRKAEYGAESARNLLGTVLGNVTTVAILLTGLLFVFADTLVDFQFPHFNSETRELTVRLTRILLPAQVAFVSGGIIRGGLMAEGRFAAQALMPIIYNFGILIGGLFLAPHIGIEGFAWGALVGAILGPLMGSLLEARGRLALVFRLSPLDAGFLNYLWIAFPLMIGVTLLTVDEWYGRWFGQIGGEGSVSSLRYARYLMLLPVAFVGQAVATAALPTLTQLFRKGDREEFSRVFQGTLKASLILAIFFAGGTWVVADSLVESVYQRGAFDKDAANAVASVLEVFALAIPGWILQEISVRGFYARSDTWRPMILGTVVALLVIPLYSFLGAEGGARGIALAGTLAITVNAVVTMCASRIRHGTPDLGDLFQSSLRSTAVALVSVWLCGRVLPLSQFSGLVELLTSGSVYCGIHFCLIMCLGDMETRSTLKVLVRRVGSVFWKVS